jgi:hypothetical protein
MCICTIDWTALGTWVGAIATFLAVVVALRQVGENQKQITRQLAHQSALQSKSLLERHLLLALEVAHREPNAARRFFLDAHRFFMNVPENVNVPEKQAEMAEMSKALESSMSAFEQEVDMSAVVLAAVAGSSNSAYTPLATDLAEIVNALRGLKSRASDLRIWLAAAQHIHDTPPGKWDNLAEVKAVVEAANSVKLRIGQLIAKLYVAA